MKKLTLILIIASLSISSFAHGFSYGGHGKGGKSFNLLGFNFGGHYTINGKSKSLTALKQPAPRLHKNLKFNKGTPRQNFGSGEMTFHN